MGNTNLPQQTKAEQYLVRFLYKSGAVLDLWVWDLNVEGAGGVIHHVEIKPADPVKRAIHLGINQLAAVWQIESRMVQETGSETVWEACT